MHVEVTESIVADYAEIAFRGRSANLLRISGSAQTYQEVSYIQKFIVQRFYQD